MEPSLFTKIINGEIPCHKVYEDDQTIAFLDIYPSRPGHTLVIPKTQVDHLWDLTDEDYRAVMDTSKKVAKRLRDVLGCERIGVKVIGFDVPHAHIHLVPINNLDDYQAAGDMSAEPDSAALAAMAQKLVF
jgi:histidine triad (HIT) family protein